MSMWTIDPRDPFVARDGRPNNGRSESIALPFPYPGTIAGITRTRLGSDARGFFEPTQDLASLLRVALRGPVLTGADGTGLYVPRPSGRRRHARESPRRLESSAGWCPVAPPAGALFDDDLDRSERELVGFAERGVGKGRAGPRLVALGDVQALARGTRARWMGTDVDNGARGCSLTGLSAEGRSHVKLTETWTSEDGMLFEVRGWRLRAEAKNGIKLSSDLPLALAFDLDPR